MKVYMVCEDYPRRDVDAWFHSCLHPIINFMLVLLTGVYWLLWGGTSTIASLGDCKARMVNSLSTNRMKKCEGIILQLYPYINLGARRGRLVNNMPLLLYLRKETQYPFYRTVGALWDLFLRGFDHQTIQPAASHYTNNTNPAAFLLHSTPCKTQTFVSNSTEDHIWLLHKTHTSQNIRTTYV